MTTSTPQAVDLNKLTALAYKAAPVTLIAEELGIDRAAVWPLIERHGLAEAYEARRRDLAGLSPLADANI